MSVQSHATQATRQSSPCPNTCILHALKNREQGSRETSKCTPGYLLTWLYWSMQGILHAKAIARAPSKEGKKGNMFSLTKSKTKRRHLQVDAVNNKQDSNAWIAVYWLIEFRHFSTLDTKVLSRHLSLSLYLSASHGISPSRAHSLSLFLFGLPSSISPFQSLS